MATTPADRVPVRRDAAAFRALIDAHRTELDAILSRYDATNPRLFGSVARGDATAASDIDIIVDLTPGSGNELLRVAGVAEELRRLLHVDVDVITRSLLRSGVAVTVEQDLVAL